MRSDIVRKLNWQRCGSKQTHAAHRYESQEDVVCPGVPSKTRRWDKIPACPPDYVTKVRLISDGTVFTRHGGPPGYYWASLGWPDGVRWNTLRQWGDLEEVEE